MKILLINNTFGNFGGGSERYTYETGKILQKKGHKVYFFASDKKPYYEEDYKYQNFFPKDINLLKASTLEKIISIPRFFYNKEAKENLDEYIKEIKPDLIHINCFLHNLTPSIFLACKENNIPVVLTFHDSYIACPTGFLMKKLEYFCDTKDCINGLPLSCLKNRCFNDSVIKSFIYSSEFFFRRLFGFYGIPKYYICPSEFILNLALKAGMDKKKVVVVNNFSSSAITNINNSEQGYFLYVGRVIKEKGIHTLVNAFKDLPNLQLRIVGEGVPAYKNELMEFIKSNNLKNIKFVGFKNGIELENEYKNCIATILPSLVGEAFGLSILESFSYGKPVIGSRIGGIPEVISNYQDGILFEPGNSRELKNAVLKFWNNKNLAQKFGENGRLKFENAYTPEVYYEKLVYIYEKAINNFSTPKILNKNMNYETKALGR